MTQKYSLLGVDSSAVKYFFKSLRKVSIDEESFWNSIELMVEIIIHEYEESVEDPYKQLMCTRGLLLLSLNEEVARNRGQETGLKILQKMN